MCAFTHDMPDSVIGWGFLATFKLATVATIMLPPLLFVSQLRGRNWAAQTRKAHCYLLVRATYMKLTPAVPRMLSHNSTLFLFWPLYSSSAQIRSNALSVHA